MPRGYRCILIAFVGWLSLAANPPGNSAGDPQPDAKAKQEQPLNRIASAIEKDERPACFAGGLDRTEINGVLTEAQRRAVWHRNGQRLRSGSRMHDDRPRYIESPGLR